MITYPFRTIRDTLGMTQQAIADELGLTQGNISFYERGQTVPPPIAAKLIELAKTRGHVITFDSVYAPALISGEDAAPFVTGDGESSAAEASAGLGDKRG